MVRRADGARAARRRPAACRHTPTSRASYDARRRMPRTRARRAVPAADRRATSMRRDRGAGGDTERGALATCCARCIVARATGATCVAVDALDADARDADRGRDGRARPAGRDRARSRLPVVRDPVRGRVRHGDVPPPGARRARDAHCSRRSTRSRCTTTGASATSCACRPRAAPRYLELLADALAGRRRPAHAAHMSDFLVNLARALPVSRRSHARGQWPVVGPIARVGRAVDAPAAPRAAPTTTPIADAPAPASRRRLATPRAWRASPDRASRPTHAIPTLHPASDAAAARCATVRAELAASDRRRCRGRTPSARTRRDPSAVASPTGAACRSRAVDRDRAVGRESGPIAASARARLRRTATRREPWADRRRPSTPRLDGVTVAATDRVGRATRSEPAAPLGRRRRAGPAPRRSTVAGRRRSSRIAVPEREVHVRIGAIEIHAESATPAPTPLPAADAPAPPRRPRGGFDDFAGCAATRRGSG